MGDQNQVKVTKGHQVQMFKICILHFYAQKKKHFKHHGRSKLGHGHRSSSSIKLQQGNLTS